MFFATFLRLFVVGPSSEHNSLQLLFVTSVRQSTACWFMKTILTCYCGISLFHRFVFLHLPLGLSSDKDQLEGETSKEGGGK